MTQCCKTFLSLIAKIVNIDRQTHKNALDVLILGSLEKKILRSALQSKMNFQVCDGWMDRWMLNTITSKGFRFKIHLVIVPKIWNEPDSKLKHEV